MLRVIALAAALAPFGADAVTYQFAFERYAAETLALVPEGGVMAGSGPYVAQRLTGSAGYGPTDIIFGFDREGSLDGLAFDLSDMGDGWSLGARGTVLFAGNAVAAWDIIDDSSDTTVQHHTSDPLDFSRFEVLNSELLPVMHFGATRYEPSIYEFALAPGRWICWADGEPCDASPDAQVAMNPVPASLLLLLSGVAGLLLVRFRLP